jgi:hypothetical protein
VESLPFVAEATLDGLLAGLAEEVAAVLPEQRGEVFARIDLGDWTKRILT